MTTLETEEIRSNNGLTGPTSTSYSSITPSEHVVFLLLCHPSNPIAQAFPHPALPYAYETEQERGKKSWTVYPANPITT